jgi:hypothetical protein
MSDPTWRETLLRYRTGRELATRVRRSPFWTETAGATLVITPRTGRPRLISKGEWERSVPMLDRAGRRAALQESTFNSSYIAAIVDDLRASKA